MKSHSVLFVRIDAALSERVKNLARLQDTSVSRVVRQMLRREVARVVANAE